MDKEISIVQIYNEIKELKDQAIINNINGKESNHTIITYGKSLSIIEKYIEIIPEEEIEGSNHPSYKEIVIEDIDTNNLQKYYLKYKPEIIKQKQKRSKRKNKQRFEEQSSVVEMFNIMSRQI